MDEDIWGSNDNTDNAKTNNDIDDRKTNSINNEHETKEDDDDDLFENRNDKADYNYNNNSELSSTNPFSYNFDNDDNNNEIRIISTEERKGSLRKYTVYIIESSVFGSLRSVARRFNDFKWLQTMLCMEYIAIFIAPLPQDNAFDRFNDDVISQRRYDLERCLNRLNENKILKKASSFELFLSEQNDTVFEEQKRLYKKELNERTEYDITSLLMRCFDGLNEEEIPQFLSIKKGLKNENENMYKLDIPRVREFFMRSNERLTLLNKVSFNLFQTFQSIHNELNVFDDTLSDLYDAEYNDKPYFIMNECSERSDIRDFVHRWNEIQHHKTNCFYKYFLFNLRYELQDIKAILDGFKRYDIIYNKYKREKINLKKLNDKYPDKNHQEFERKLHEIKDLLDIVCKIILIHQTPKLWDKKIKDYNKAIREYIKNVTQKVF